MENQPQEKPKIWFRRHPIATFFLFLFVLFVIVGATSNNQNNIPTVAPALTPTPEPTSVSPQTTQPDAAQKKLDSDLKKIQELQNQLSHQAESPSPSPTVPAPKPTPTPAPSTPKTWHVAFTYQNNLNSINTAPFSMQGSQWRITYSCSPTDPSSSNYFGFSAESVTKDIAPGLLANNGGCSKSNVVSYSYGQKPGQYYLEINSDNTTYDITIEDYY